MSGTEAAVIHREQWETEDLRYVCGLANAGGGTMVIAQSGKGGLLSIRRPFEQIPRLVENELGIQCTTEPVLEGASLCLEITVPAATEPVAYNGTYWFYEDGKLIRKSRDEISASQAEEQDSTWEMRRQPQGLQKELNSSGYMAIMSLEMDDEGSPSDTMEETLSRRLGYLNLKGQDEGSLTNAGVLILHNKPESLIPGASVRIALFDHEHGQLIRQSEVLGPIPHQLAESVRLIYDEYLPSVIPPDDASRAMPPKEAVREAILNALVHKNYEAAMPVRISIYPDKLVVQNPIATADDAEAQVILEGGTARPANPIMANTLRLMGLANGWGGSINRMRKLCEGDGLAAPDIQHDQNEASVTFFFRVTKSDAADSGAEGERLGQHARPLLPPDEAASRGPSDAGDEDVEDGEQARADAPSAQAAPTVEESVTSHGMNMSGLSSSTPKNAPFNVRSVAAANRLDLTATDEYVLRVLHTNGRATAVRIANVLGVSESTVRRSFRKLKEHGLIERIGSDKAGYWRVLS